MNLKWLIYCRVSSTKQAKEWNGLSSQEKRCRDYAINTLWIEVEKVFNDEWVSWWVFERKSIRELFNYIDNNKNSSYVVIFEDLNRLSRDIQVHWLLKAEFKKRWVELASPNFQFEESPEWTFRENMSVSMAQYEKDKNRQRVNDRMRARLEQGFWCFSLPLWYKYSTNSKWWKEILLDENNYKIIKSVLEKYANNELKTINDVARYLNKKWLKVWTIKNWKVYNANLVSRILQNILYSWYIEFPKWWIERIKANHKALISIQTYDKIQNKINNTPQKIVAKIEENDNRIDKSDDFPLRWFLYCEKSNHLLSWWWSKWKKSKFPYYVYPKKSPLYWKSINRDVLHNEFEGFLKAIQPKEELILAFEKAIEIVIKDRKKNQVDIKEKFKKEIIDIDKKINNYITRIWKTNSETLIENYEKQIEDLEKEKIKISQKIDDSIKIDWTPLKRKTKLVRNALYIWKSSNLDNKKSLLKNIFPEGIPINEKRQVWTPTFSLIYQAISIWESSFSEMVDPSGLEPETFALRGRCSTNWAKSPKNACIF